MLCCECWSTSHTSSSFFFFNDTATTEIYTLSLHDALPILRRLRMMRVSSFRRATSSGVRAATRSGSKLWNASRKPGHLASTTRQLMPAWKTALVIVSRISAGEASSICSGRLIPGSMGRPRSGRSARDCVESPGDRVPVDRVPPGVDVVGTAVLVLQVVGVLPDVHAQQRVPAVGQGVVLVGGRDHREARAVVHEPGPAGAELVHAGVLHLRLELVE